MSSYAVVFFLSLGFVWTAECAPKKAVVQNEPKARSSNPVIALLGVGLVNPNLQQEEQAPLLLQSELSQDPALNGIQIKYVSEKVWGPSELTTEEVDEIIALKSDQILYWRSSATLPFEIASSTGFGFDEHDLRVVPIKPSRREVGIWGNIIASLGGISSQRHSTVGAYQEVLGQLRRVRLNAEDFRFLAQPLIQQTSTLLWRVAGGETWKIGLIQAFRETDLTALSSTGGLGNHVLRLWLPSRSISAQLQNRLGQIGIGDQLSILRGSDYKTVPEEYFLPPFRYTAAEAKAWAKVVATGIKQDLVLSIKMSSVQGARL